MAMTPEQQQAFAQKLAADPELLKEFQGKAQDFEQPQQEGGLLQGNIMGGIRGAIQNTLAAAPGIIGGKAPSFKTLSGMEDKASPFERLAYAEMLRRGRPEEKKLSPYETEKQKQRAREEARPKELTPSGLIGLYKIMNEPPEGKRTGGVFGFGPGSKQEYSPDQQALRDYAETILAERGAAVPIAGKLEKPKDVEQKDWDAATEEQKRTFLQTRGQ